MTAHTAEQIIEQMARAMAHKAGQEWDSVSSMSWRIVAGAAYAECLRMLREPDQGQMAVAMHHTFSAPNWRGMIDARIKELG